MPSLATRRVTQLGIVDVQVHLFAAETPDQYGPAADERQRRDYIVQKILRLVRSKPGFSKRSHRLPKAIRSRLWMSSERRQS